MGLENVFNKQEKPKEESELQVVNIEESLVQDLLRCFESSKQETIHKWSDYFRINLLNLKCFTITPKVINSATKRLPTYSWRFEKERQYQGVFLSSLIQTSYNQGFNNFEFEKINFSKFCSFLQGKESSPIQLKIWESRGWELLFDAEHCSLKADFIMGRRNLNHLKNCILILGKVDGYENLDTGLENCTIEMDRFIDRCEYRRNFRRNCTIYSQRKTVLEMLKGRQDLTKTSKNKFIQGHMPIYKEKLKKE